jgi:hypothetical protein
MTVIDYVSLFGTILALYADDFLQFLGWLFLKTDCVPMKTIVSILLLIISLAAPIAAQSTFKSLDSPLVSIEAERQLALMRTSSYQHRTDVDKFSFQSSIRLLLLARKIAVPKFKQAWVLAQLALSLTVTANRSLTIGGAGSRNVQKKRRSLLAGFGDMLPSLGTHWRSIDGRSIAHEQISTAWVPQSK